MIQYPSYREDEQTSNGGFLFLPVPDNVILCNEAGLFIEQAMNQRKIDKNEMQFFIVLSCYDM